MGINIGFLMKMAKTLSVFFFHYKPINPFTNLLQENRDESIYES